jgi:hypothetical protein
MTAEFNITYYNNTINMYPWKNTQDPAHSSVGTYLHERGRIDRHVEKDIASM